MSATATVSLMTTEEMLALPENGTERSLIRGRLRENPMTKRNRFHSRTEARIAQILGNWLDQQPEPRGEVFSGEAGVILRRNPDTTVGIDVVLFPPDVAVQDPEHTSMIEGVPLLAVEILSPNDTQEEIDEKVDEYLAAGVALVWLVNPHFRTVTVHRPGAEPELFNVTQELPAEPHLPGFRVPVARIFGR
ncbi:MAG TPA: Uma2 family endonuclease [Gemmataceae bacterium]|nr:Uma2 family endonuclease [Gemmataceae bacterium]